MSINIEYIYNICYYIIAFRDEILMLDLKNIKFERDNKKILDDVNLKIDSNKFVAITGPNGSGKSTLAKIIMGIEKPDSGKIIFEGKDITNYSIDERAKL